MTSRSASATTVLDVRDLEVALDEGSSIVSEITFRVQSGEVLGLVGESGSGKTTIGLALLGYARSGARIAGGSVSIEGSEILGLSPSQTRARRGKRIAYVPQDPMTALNPALRIGPQLDEVLMVHEPKRDRGERAARVAQALSEIGLPADKEFLHRFPHQLSGGQQQRIAFAMAVLPRPAIVVCDEPTTGLDVITQASVLETIRALCSSYGVAIVYVTHDLGVVSELADRVMVLYAGRMAELGDRDDIFHRPAHPYTARLIAASPDIAEPRMLASIPGHPPLPDERPRGCAFAPRCALSLPICETPPPRHHLAEGHWSYCHRAAEVSPVPPVPLPGRPAETVAAPALRIENVTVKYGDAVAVDGVSLAVGSGECLAVVGGSGTGKTTLAKAIVGLEVPSGGRIELDGQPLAATARRRTSAQRRELQYVFQNPYASLNPRHTVARTLEGPLHLLPKMPANEAQARVSRALEQVQLPVSYAARYPDQLSGGQRQRVALARALVVEPTVLVCDEVTSALDVSVQAAIVDQLAELQAAAGFALVFITHNLALVRSVADRVAVMEEGRLVDMGPAEKLLAGAATHPYTERLRNATPSITGALTDHSDRTEENGTRDARLLNS